MPSSADLFRTHAEKRLAELRRNGQYRTLVVPPRHVVNLCSNDYLGLGTHVQWQAALRRILAQRAGATASRLLGGEHAIFSELEDAFSTFKGSESSLLFPSGYAANEAIVQSLATLDAHFFSDQWNHASLIDGCRIARLDKTRLTIFPHRDTSALEEALARSPAPLNVILTESIFSMDGDAADLPALWRLAESYRGLLVVDEAHAMGLFGRDGRGKIDESGLPSNRVVSVNTLGKALALHGAIVSGPAWLRELLINVARPFIYTTGPSPWLAEAALYTMTSLVQWDCYRSRVLESASELRRCLRAGGWDVGQSESPIVPLIVGEADEAVKMADELLEAGFFCRAVRPPTVPPGTSRLRLSLTAAISDAQLDRLTRVLLERKTRR